MQVGGKENADRRERKCR